MDDVIKRSEHVEQREFVSWFRKTYPGVLIFAIPNGGRRGKSEALRLKCEGVTPGIPDLFIPAWKLWVEMKVEKGGKVSPDQQDMMIYLSGVGYDCIVGHGFNDAKEKILSLMSKKD